MYETPDQRRANNLFKLEQMYKLAFQLKSKKNRVYIPFASTL